MIPPKAFIPRLTLLTVAELLAVLPVAAATYGMTVLPETSAVAFCCSGPSEFGVAKAVGVVGVPPGVRVKAATVEAEAKPETRTSRMSTTCVEEPP
jgi:hypothetical protein